MVSVFAAYPIAQHYADHSYTNTTSYIGPPSASTPKSNTTIAGSGGLINQNAPKISHRALVDPDTPKTFLTKKGVNGEQMTLVFSDEFNVEGRTFYTGEDPFWEAVDLHCPIAAITSGLPGYNNVLSYLPGQRLSACTCPGENHPGPVLADGSFPGRSASEIDIFEATSQTSGGQISQTAQWAPFNPAYSYLNATTDEVEYYESPFDTKANTYKGGIYQQGTSGLSNTNVSTYDSTTSFAMYGLEYVPTYMGGAGTGKITWLQEDLPMWTVTDKAMAANSVAKVSMRPVTGEPMYMILNHGMSQGFQPFDVTKLTFPAAMRIRNLVPADKSAKYRLRSPPISKNANAYYNMNLTTYQQFLTESGSTLEGFPKNRLIDTC
ncbi:beta-glucan synthesis-associated protein KRE6, partial [Phenoliferia sp. Uapishka_3]